MDETAAPAQVSDNPALLAALLEDARNESELWTPTSYWRGYCARILRELRRTGLRDFRRNALILKGFASSGAAEPTLPRAAWKRGVWRALEAAPLFTRIIAEYRRLLTAEAVHRRAREIRLAGLALDAIAERFPDFDPPTGIANGNAWDAFDWRGHRLSADWTMYAARAADFYAQVPREEVTGLVEIGPGLGLSTLAHIALNPHLRLAVHVDVVPVVYVASQYLASISRVRVIDYLATRDQARIPLEADAPVTILQLAPWQLPKLDGQVACFFNAYSFQEMEPETCANYARHLCRLAARGGLLHSSIHGHRPGAGGQRAPVTMAFLEKLFAPSFPRVSRVDGFWPRFFGGDLKETRLFLR